jgi:hypothetical protein
VTWAELRRSPERVLCDWLQELLIAADFDILVETVCQPYYAAKVGAPGRCFQSGFRERLAPTAALTYPVPPLQIPAGGGG